MVERRALERIQLNQLALVVSDGIRGVHPATVRNISPAGACISIPPYFCASAFKLSFDGFHRSIACRVMWKTGEQCGVSFVSDWCGSQAATPGDSKCGCEQI
ncbi:PilZ domain-containing protein [Bradyrhizobium diazoefficiens]|nr:PilZ domain-containing protein [Bradyrhizobium diazoefficiens]MBR0777912.1 PilZ domain-containing protein [Bradyrhizobium diazoefficiens]MBR0847254.1 PilZ domain-containing protein [Bradyrhizobium diazoefficiens]